MPDGAAPKTDDGSVPSGAAAGTEAFPEEIGLAPLEEEKPEPSPAASDSQWMGRISEPNPCARAGPPDIEGLLEKFEDGWRQGAVPRIEVDAAPVRQGNGGAREGVAVKSQVLPPPTIRSRIALWLPVLLLMYVSGYYASVRPHYGFVSGIGPWPLQPEYDVGGAASEVLFYPIHQLDRVIRPRYWEYP